VRGPLAHAGRVAVLVTAAVVLSSCYGSTEPATNVAFDGAVLHAQGTANSGPVQSYFEYWPTSTPAARLTTVPRNWPAGASAPFTETVDETTVPGGPLVAGAAYSFRVCGNDQGAQAVCAQARTFTTPAATGDVVEGSWSSSLGSPHANTGTVHATSGTSGQGSGGLVRLSLRSTTATDYAGRVTCLKVTGHHAVVVSIGEARGDGKTPNPNLNPPTASVVLTVDDGGPGVEDKVSAPLVLPSATPSCTGGTTVAQDTESVGVFDAP
jgi:hypothetical protein